MIGKVRAFFLFRREDLRGALALALLAAALAWAGQACLRASSPGRAGDSSASAREGRRRIAMQAGRQEAPSPRRAAEERRPGRRAAMREALAAPAFSPAPGRAAPPPPPCPPKYPAGTVIDLNRAGISELKRVPGIGGAAARRIAGYRRRLGGFYSVEQLREVSPALRRAEGWFRVEPRDVRRIDLNRAGMDRLLSHPYFNFRQAKAVVELRRRAGSLRSLKELRLLEEFSPEDLERIGRYARCE